MSEATKNPSLRELLALPVSVSIGDKRVEIAPMGWMQAAQAIEPLMAAIGSLPPALAGYDKMSRDDKVGSWVAIVLANREELAQFASRASGFAQEEIEQLQPLHFAELLFALFELNADFFVRSLPGLLERVAGRLPALKAKLQASLAAATAATGTGSTTSSSA